MHLDYRLNEDRETDWSSVTEEDLRYRVALGNLVFHVGDKDFSADWNWIPLVDLAASFAEIVRKLEGGSAGETAQVPTACHGANENVWIHEVLGEADAIAQQRTVRKR